MSRRARTSHVRRMLGALVLALSGLGCQSGGDYYYLNEIKGQGDTVILRFLHTCGVINITWDGSFGALPNYQSELVVDHDAGGEDCEEDPREVPFDAGPMKQSFRAEHLWPTPLALRIAPFEEEHGAMCLANVFQDEPFKGRRCK
jgi:hypothetical protein